jgi:hypothetical protein
MPRLGFARPDSMKLRCRCETFAESARVNWLSCRRRAIRLDARRSVSGVRLLVFGGSPSLLSCNGPLAAAMTCKVIATLSWI